MGHGALGIVCGDLPKCVAGICVCEGMKQGYTAIETRLGSRRAGDGEGYAAELQGRGVVMHLLCSCSMPCKHQNKNKFVQVCQLRPVYQCAPRSFTSDFYQNRKDLRRVPTWQGATWSPSGVLIALRKRLNQIFSFGHLYGKLYPPMWLEKVSVWQQRSQILP
jgi:hypothetical protein